MDSLHHRLANALVGNPSDAAALEFGLTGPTLRFHCDTVVALAGEEGMPCCFKHPVGHGHHVLAPVAQPWSPPACLRPTPSGALLRASAGLLCAGLTPSSDPPHPWTPPPKKRKKRRCRPNPPAGAVFAASLDGAPVPWNASFAVRRGQELALGGVDASTGVRGYLAVAGGLDVPLYLGSRSTFPNGNFGGFQGRWVCARLAGWRQAGRLVGPEVARTRGGGGDSGRHISCVHKHRRVLHTLTTPAAFARS